MRLWIFYAISISVIWGCSKNGSSNTNTSETAHFVFKWETGEADIGEIEEAKLFAERVFSEYEAYFGADKLPQGKTIIHLGGNAFSGNGGDPKIPFVDGNGQVFLYRFATGYLGELPHEFIHVVRLYEGWSADGFLEEGLAEAMSSHLFPENVGFSLYGYSTTVAAGLWLQEEEIIPLEELKDRHFDLNLKCLPQSYSLRADFFTFIFEEYGKQDFIDFIYGTDAGTHEGYERVFGKSLIELEELWLQNLQQRVNIFSDLETQIQAYKAKIYSLDFYACKNGIDF